MGADGPGHEEGGSAGSATGTMAETTTMADKRLVLCPFQSKQDPRLLLQLQPKLKYASESWF
jgi:hypothetical protein